MSKQETNDSYMLKANSLFEKLNWKSMMKDSYHASFGFVHDSRDYLMSIGCGIFYGGQPVHTKEDAKSSSKYEVAILDLNPDRENEWATGKFLHHKFFHHTSKNEEVTRISRQSLMDLLVGLLSANQEKHEQNL